MNTIVLCAWLMIAPALDDICILDPVTVSQLRGHVVYRLKGANDERVGSDVVVQVIRADGDGHSTIVGGTRTNAQGKFVLKDVPPGEYELRVFSAAASLAVQVKVVHAGLFRWFPANWLEVGLGLAPPQGCPPSYVKAKRR